MNMKLTVKDVESFIVAASGMRESIREAKQRLPLVDLMNTWWAGSLQSYERIVSTSAFPWDYPQEARVGIKDINRIVEWLEDEVNLA